MVGLINYKFSFSFLPPSHLTGTPSLALAADLKAIGQGNVSLVVGSAHVFQQAAALANHLQQTAPRGMVLRMRLQMIGELFDAAAEQCDLDFR
jgi:hypothetical protein